MGTGEKGLVNWCGACVQGLGKGSLETSVDLGKLNRHRSHMLMEEPPVPLARKKEKNSLASRNFLQVPEGMGAFV